MTNTFLHDLRYAVRSFTKSPGFTLVAVLTLALGVGANTAIFSVLHAVVLRGLPYHEADRVAVMWTRNLQQNLPDGSSYLNFRDWKAQSREFEQMAAYLRPEFTRGTLSGDGESVRVNVGLVGPGFFELLGTAPVAGRAFVSDDFTDRATAVVISYGLWQQRFGGDPRTVGRTIQVDGASAEVVGVMPPEFELPTADVQLWRPLWFGPNWQGERSRSADALIVLGRLRPGATIESARAEMDAIAARLRTEYPTTNASFGVTTDALVDRVVGPTTQRSLWLLFGSVGFVLLIACANVANLMLARVTARSREFSVRTALGASRARLIAQALAENLVLSLLGAVAGALVAWLGVLALRAWAAGVLPRAGTIQLDARVLLFALAAALGCGLLAGLLPALQLSIGGTANALRDAGPRLLGGRSGRRLHQGLVVAEIALAVILLSGAGLLIRSFVRVQTTARGFDSSNVLLLQVDLPASYDNNRPKITTFFNEALQRIRALPGVIAAGAVSDFFIHRQPDFRIALEGRPARRPSDAAPPLTGDNIVPGYFEAMRIPLLRGRFVDDRDLVPNAPFVVVINEEMARRFWPGEDPVGKRFKYGLDPSANMPWTAVVGVVADMRRQRLDEAPIPYMFRPGAIGQMDIAVRTSGNPDALRGAIRAQMEALDPTAPPYGIITVEERLSQSVALRRFQTLLLAALAAVALTLALVGAYSIIHRSVASRTQEIGIRSALGASASTISTMVLTSGLSLGVAGLAIGLVGSVALSRAVASFLYETSPFDPLTYLVVTILLLVVTTAATLTPARRAARIDPMAALRDR
ncbi:MAG TPA: ABC transporter permease [Vicinamibacterales bacterium]|nr:ABC transporter permease [Vicinamibacterales bacterium]